ncbi:putative damage-inducible protein DinB [Paenibacillus sp. OAE614]
MLIKTLFQYNWQVREDWFRWCESVPAEELLRTRTGGVGGILHTLFHIVDVEWSWVRCLQGKPDFQESFDGYRSLDKVLKLQESFKPEVEEFVYSWNDAWEYNVFRDVHPDGHPVEDRWGEVVRHMIAHEIHHVGQLSVWSRELGIKPVSANLIGRGLMNRQA